VGVLRHVKTKRSFGNTPPGRETGSGGRQDSDRQNKAHILVTELPEHIKEFKLATRVCQVQFVTVTSF